MDGSYARNDDPESCYAKEVLESPLVDIFSWHYYGSGDTQRVKKDCQISQRYKKVFIAGEFGFYNTPGEYDEFLSALDSAGGSFSCPGHLSFTSFSDPNSFFRCWFTLLVFEASLFAGWL